MLNLSVQNNSPSFNSMYGVGRDWNKSFPIEKEKEFLVNLLGEIRNKQVKYVKNDGIIYQFEMQKNDIFFTKEKEHMMANIKCVSKGNEDMGCYVINDSSDSAIKGLFSYINNALSSIAGKHKATTSVLRNPSKGKGLMINFNKN